MSKAVRKRSLIWISLLLTLTACNANQTKFRTGELTIATKERNLKYKIEIADNDYLRSQGLMHRRTLPVDQGMLLLYIKPTRVNIWMKNTFIPLDIIYINDENEIVKIIQNAKPESTKLMSSETKIKAVLELNAGQVNTQQIAVGDRISYQRH